MLTPEKLLEYSQSNKLTDLIDGLSDDALRELARLIAESAKYFTEDEKNMSLRNNFLGSVEWQNWVATSINGNRAEMFRRIDEINKYLPGRTREIYEAAALESYSYQADTFQRAFELGLIREAPVKFSENPTIQRIIEAGIEQTAGELDNFTRTIAKRTNGNLQAILSQAHLQYVTGTFTRENAVRNALRLLYADNGEDKAKNVMKMIEYPSGHKNYVDVAVRRAIIGGLNLTTSKMNMDLGERYEAPIAETSAHLFARDTGVGYENHQNWQGRRYSYKGRAPEFPDFEESCGYEGDNFGKYGGLGILGYGCRHSFTFTFPWTEPAWNPDDYISPDVEWNGRTYTAYEAVQKLQHPRERRIKALKRELIVHDEAQKAAQNDDVGNMEKSAFQSASVRLKRAESNLRKFCEETGLEYQPNRVQLYGFDRSVSGKAVQANRRYQKERAR